MFVKINILQVYRGFYVCVSKRVTPSSSCSIIKMREHSYVHDGKISHSVILYLIASFAISTI